MEEKSVENNQKIVKLLFPLVYHDAGSKDNQAAIAIYELLREYLQTQPQQCIYAKEKDRKELMSQLAFSKKTIKNNKIGAYTKFMCEYGCALLIIKHKLQSPITIQIVVPQEWGSGSSSCKKEKLQFCEPKSQSTIYTPELVQYQNNLSSFMSRFQQQLNRRIDTRRQECDKNKQITKFTPQQIQEAVKYSAKYHKTYYDYKQQNPQQNKEDQQDKQNVSTIGENLDFKNSNANTAWYVVQALVRKLITDKKGPKQSRLRCDKLLIGFKSSILMKAIQEKQKSNQIKINDIVIFKKCLNQLIYSYKHSISQHSKKNEKFLQIIRKIEQKLIQINGGRLTSKIQDNLMIQDDHINLDQLEKSIIKIPDRVKHGPEKIQMAEISQFNYEIDKRLPFESLLSMYNEVVQNQLWEKKSELDKQQFLDHWVLVTEKTIFELAEQVYQKDPQKQTIDLLIHMREIQCEIGSSNLCRLAILYQEVIKKKTKHYGMGLEGQAMSHIQLFKAICSVVAFQSVKMNRQRRKSNLKNYKVPIDIQKLYKNFISHDYLARRAVSCLNAYHIRRKNKKSIFQLNGNCESFAQFGKWVGQQTRGAHIWLANMQRILDLQKQLLVSATKIKQVQKKIISLEKVKDMVKRHGAIFDQDSWRTQYVTEYISEPLKQYSDSQKWLYAFVHNFPPDILGLIKILLLSQNPKQSTDKNLFDQNQFQTLSSIEVLKTEKLPITIHNRKPASLNSKYISSNIQNLKNQIGSTQPNKNIKIIFGNCQQAYGIRQFIFQHYQNQNFQSTLNQFLKPPSDSQKSRQHSAYAQQYLKPNNIQIQQFLALCTTRAAQQTQIITLCHNILNRKIIANCYDIGHKFKQQLFLQTAGQISAYNFKTQQYFGIIRKILRQFVNVWVYSDTNFCPILGPFIGYLIRQLKDNKINQDQIEELKKTSLKLSKKCYQQFERGQRELIDNPQLKIQWDQRFIITAAICCFRQTSLKEEDTEQIIFLTKLIFQLRICKIFSDRQDRVQNKRKFQIQLSYSLTKTVSQNIITISNFLINNQQKFNQILTSIDDGFPESIDWQRKQLYQFIGRSLENEDVYQIDLYRGKIFKNGKQVSALDPKIKQNKNFKRIFGQNRQFQVYQSNEHHFLRTKNNLNHQFKVDKKQVEIYFEFSQDGQTIRYVVRQPHQKGQKSKQSIWQLMPITQLIKSKVHFPKLYLQNYFAWFCAQKNCIIFRRCQYQRLYDIGLIIHLEKQSMRQLSIRKAFHVVFPNGFQNQIPKQIQDINNSCFQQITLRSKQRQLTQIKPYFYISKFEDPKFVLQLRNQKTNQTHFLLHRYQLRFKLKQNKLVSESHYGYSIQSSYYKIKQCLFNKFPCLVLKKDDKNQIILNNHNRILIISDGKIKQKGEIIKSKAADKHLISFRYDIHDFFGDIRGSTRESQFHLVSLMISINDNIRLSSLQMTPLQLAINIFKTCFTNRPLNVKEKEKLLNIFQIEEDEVLLMCQILWKGSQKLKQILPFPQQKQEKRQLSAFIKQNEKSLLQCRTLYQKKITNQTINYRQRVSYDMLKFIGFNLKQTKKSSNDKQSDQSSSQFEQQNYWKGVQQYKGQGIVQQCKQIQQMYDKLCQKTTQIDYCSKEYPLQKIQQNNQNKFPIAVQKNAVGDNKSLMMSEFIDQLKKSHQCFIKEQHKLEQIGQQFIGQKKHKNIMIVKELLQNSKTLLKKIQSMILKIKQQNKGHPDIISGFRPTLAQVFYTRILCCENQIFAYYPKITKKAAQKLKLAIKIWMDIQTRIACYQRVQNILNMQKFDIVAFLRETGSPRKLIFNNTAWVCFQTQMKIQIWPSQLETYNNLMKNYKMGPFCQLNMGQGKTQVIIPMIILNTIFERQKVLPRINLLSSLYQQARGNMFRFLSVTGFQIPGFQIPFTRKVQLNRHNIYAIRDLMNCFSGKAYILVNRQSRLSQVLRYNQMSLLKQQQEISLQKLPLLNCNIFDIFDQIDAMMTPKKSYIFSIGDQIQLPSSIIRLQILKQCIEVYLKITLQELFNNKMVTSDQTFQDALKSVQKGQYPEGLRLTLQKIPHDQLHQWKLKIAKYLLKNPQRHEYSFVQKLSQQQFKLLLNYCVNPLADSGQLPCKISDRSKDQIFILRGALAYGILEHCLSKRCGVDFGVPNEYHVKKIAVPYQAADIPSKTSQFQHPQVSALLSYISYNMKGLSQDQFKKCIRVLLSLSSTSMENQYQKWIQILSQKDRKQLIINKAKKININSKADQLKLYQIFRKNRKTIAFWLIKCIFPRDLKQYVYSICSSSFDLAHVQQSVGFSGTMDNHWILPNKIKFTPCQTPSIKGTDGKMIHLATKCTKQIDIILQNEKPLWQRFIDLALKKKTGCIIDVGAICVGKSLKNQIVPWLAEHQLLDKQRFIGISFCDENGKWQVYDIENKFYINRGTTIPDHQTFVIFDEARTRGADLKMDSDIVAAVSLGPDLTKDKFMQAIGRLRKLGRNQSIIILATHQVFSSLPTFPKQFNQIQHKLKQIDTKDLIQLILAWCCHNTIRDNQNLLLQYLNLGWRYVYSKVNKKPLNQQIQSKLKQKYQAILQTRTVAQISMIVSNKKSQLQLQHPTGKHLQKVLEKYGKNVLKKVGALDDVCQRQVEAEKQQEKQQQNEFKKLIAIQQKDQPKLISQIRLTPYNFDKKLLMTTNFIETTQSQNPNIHIIAQKSIDNQLPISYFVKYSANQFIMISLREASIFIKQNVQKESMCNQYISLLDELSVDNQFIKTNKLQGAYVCAKFIAGCQNFDIKQQKYLIQFLLRSLRLKGKNQQDRRKDHENIVSIILKRRRIHYKKFSGSTLQKMITRLANEDLPDTYKQQVKAKNQLQMKMKED